MTASIPTNEPAELRAGDTWQWRREDLSDYPASAGWSLKYYFRNAAAKFDITAAADGDAFAVEVAKASTGKTPGAYDWIAVVESTTHRHQIDAGRLTVLPNLATDVVYDARTFARKMLDYIEAALLNRASGDQLDLINAQLDQRSMTRDKSGLTALRNQYRAEVRAEENAARIADGKPSRNRILAVC